VNITDDATTHGQMAALASARLALEPQALPRGLWSFHDAALARTAMGRAGARHSRLRVTPCRCERPASACRRPRELVPDAGRSGLQLLWDGGRTQTARRATRIVTLAGVVRPRTADLCDVGEDRFDRAPVGERTRCGSALVEEHQSGVREGITDLGPARRDQEAQQGGADLQDAGQPGLADAVVLDDAVDDGAQRRAVQSRWRSRIIAVRAAGVSSTNRPPCRAILARARRSRCRMDKPWRRPRDVTEVPRQPGVLFS
jgi:hypothetical protein